MIDCTKALVRIGLKPRGEVPQRYVRLLESAKPRGDVFIGMSHIGSNVQAGSYGGKGPSLALDLRPGLTDAMHVNSRGLTKTTKIEAHFCPVGSQSGGDA